MEAEYSSSLFIYFFNLVLSISLNFNIIRLHKFYLSWNLYAQYAMHILDISIPSSVLLIYTFEISHISYLMTLSIW